MDYSYILIDKALKLLCFLSQITKHTDQRLFV